MQSILALWKFCYIADTSLIRTPRYVSVLASQPPAETAMKCIEILSLLRTLTKTALWTLHVVLLYSRHNGHLERIFSGQNMKLNDF